MAQKTSPFIESKYGWNLGENGWNVGADENFVKFGFMLDNGVDGVVSSLPQTPTNGTSYYLTTDNRFYFVVDGTYYSSPCPKWFTFKLKITGEKRIYDGSGVVTLPSDIDVSSILNSVGTSSNSLKTNLANKTDINQGSNLVGYIIDASSVGRTVRDKLKDFVSIKDFGAVEGQDIGVFIQKAHDQGYTKVFINEGKYKWTTAVTITKSIQLIGAGYQEGPDAGAGTWFELNQTGFTPITFSGASARGSKFLDCAFWESNHPTSQIQGWAPANNDYIVKVLNCLGSVDLDLFMVRVNRGVYCYNSGRMNIQKIKGQFYTAGVEVDNCLDIPRIEYLHAWTFYTTNQYVLAYQQANLDVIILRRVDGIFLGDIFALGCRSWLRLDSSADGVPTKIYNNAGYADFAKYGVWIPSGANNVTAQFSQLTVQGEDSQNGGIGLTGGSALRIDASGASIQIGLLHTQRHYQSALVVNGGNNRVDIGEFWVERSNQANDSSPVISLLNNASSPNQVNLTGGVRVTDSNSPPIINGSTNGTLMVGAIANVSNGSVDEPRLYWGNGNSSLSSVSPNTSSSLFLESKGLNGSTHLRANGKTVLRVDDGAGTANCAVLIRPTAVDYNIIAEGGATNVNINFSPKGTGTLNSNAPIKFPGYTFVGVPSASTYNGATIRITDRSQRLATSDGTNWRFMDGNVIA